MAVSAADVSSDVETIREAHIVDLLLAVARPDHWIDSPERKAAWDEIKRRDVERLAARAAGRENVTEALREIAAIKPDSIRWVEQNHARLRKAVSIARAALDEAGDGG